MPTNKEIFNAAMNEQVDITNSKAGTTGKKQIPQSNIILSGITPLKGDTVTVTPTNEAQTITPTSPKNGFTSVGVEAVVCENLSAENIKSGVTVRVGTATDDDSVTSVTGAYSSDQPTLNAPTISLSGNTITISNPSSNGNYVEGYKIFLDGNYHSYTTETSVTISDVGTFAVTVKASGTNFTDSPASNSVTVTNYSISVTATHCTADVSNPTIITSGSTATLVFTADNDYEVRASGVTAVNATVISVDKTTGTVVIGSATGNVTLTVVGEVPLTAAILTVTGLGNEDPTTVTFTESGAEFDWTALTEETIDGNVFIKIPTMYRKVNTVESNQITSFSLSDTQVDNTYEPYPCFVDGNDILPYVYIGKYCFTNTSTASSVSGTTASLQIGNARTLSQNLGTGYQLYDWQLQKLFVDLAMMKAQTVNFQDGSAAITEYLGIAHLDNRIWIDGIFYNYSYSLGRRTWAVGAIPSEYANGASGLPTGYTELSYLPAEGEAVEVKKLGYDSGNPFVNYPSATVINSNMDTYYCDWWYNRGGVSPIYTGIGFSNKSYGLWATMADISWTDTARARLCYRPISSN